MVDVKVLSKPDCTTCDHTEKMVKGYFLIITCCCTRVVHIELTPDFTNLVIRDTHEKNFRNDINSNLNFLHNKYCSIQGRQSVKSFL